MIRSFFPSAPLGFLALSLLAPPAFAVTEAEAIAGRAVLKRHADAIVGIELVVTIKISNGGPAQPRESKIETDGTVVSAAGLTVTSLARIDPRVQLEGMRAMGGGSRMEIGETDYKEVKLRLSDGTEVPARIVLKDADLDLAFIVPDPFNEASKRTFPFVDLGDAVEGAVLDNFYNLMRAPKALQRTPMVRPSVVFGVVEKPRRLYIINEPALACPVFDAKGRVLGVTLQHIANGRTTGVVTIPAADIAEIAVQAAAVKIEPPRPPEPAIAAEAEAPPAAAAPVTPPAPVAP